jgi:WD40 repeat protein
MREVLAVAYSPDGCFIASASVDGSVFVWDAQTGQALRRFPGHGFQVTGMAFSPDGQRIATQTMNYFGKDKTLRVLDAQTGLCREVLLGSGDTAAIAAGPHPFPWRSLVCGLEMVCEDVSTGRAVASFPAALQSVTTHTAGRAWAGHIGNHLYVLRLEGCGQDAPAQR